MPLCRLDATISASSKQDSGEGSRLFKIMAKSFSKRWQSGEITNFQYLMHLNTLAGRGYSDLTQYPVFPWVLADYESDTLDLRNPRAFRKLDKPMGCQTEEGEEEFRKRFVHLTKSVYFIFNEKIILIVLNVIGFFINQLKCSILFLSDTIAGMTLMYQNSIMVLIIQVLGLCFSIF
jgi:hypothetical protein